MQKIMDVIRPWLGAGLAVMILSIIMNSYFIWKIDRLEGWLKELGTKHNNFTRETARVVAGLHKTDTGLMKCHNQLVRDLCKEFGWPVPPAVEGEPK